MKKIEFVKLTMVAIALSIASCSNSTPTAQVETNNNETTATQTENASSTPSEAVKVVAVNPELSLTPADDWQENNHVHGIAVNPVEPQIVYVATHHGLVQRSLDGKWLLVGSDRSDYMGFAVHPTDTYRLYSSGHPHNGGNLGFRVTDNQGEDWQVISMPGVDFHALAVAPSNPDVIYGWATSGKQGFFVSPDGGKTWDEVRPEGLGGSPFNFVVAPENSDRLFAVTRNGLFESTNGGKNWQLIPNTDYVPVIGLALVKEGDKTAMYGYRVLNSGGGIYQSVDGGTDWELISNKIEGTILYLTVAPSNPDIMYAVNEENTIFQSVDRGKSWKPLS